MGEPEAVGEARQSGTAIQIRRYREADAPEVGRLIADTFSQFNLSSATDEQRSQLLGPFLHARSADGAHQEAIARAIQSEMVIVAECDGEIAGVLRGRTARLGSLFVRGDHHRRGIGRRLVECFEQEVVAQGGTTVKVAATLYAVPFYLRMGYKRTTGVRPYHGFGGSGIDYQPMKKVLRERE